MIYFFYNTDSQKGIEKARKLFVSLQTKKPDASFLEYDSESVSEIELERLIGQAGLFEQKSVVLFKQVLDQKDKKEELLSFVKDFKDSDNIFIWVESKLLKKELELLKKSAEKADVEDKKEVSKKEYNVFELANFLASRDKKNLWAGLVTAFERDVKPEEIHGILFWKLKMMVGGSSKFSSEEVSVMLKEMVEMYHEAHRGKVDFKIELEKFALSL